MHDIGRTQQEYSGEIPEMQPETFEFSAGEGELLGEGFEAGLQETEYTGEFGEFGEFGESETYESESPLSEAQEMALAAELLEVSSEQELDQFLGKLIRSVGRGFQALARSPLGRAVGGVLKQVAKKALPIAGGALGSFFGGPVGGMLGSKLAGVAGKAFGLETEGMSNEDAQFEVARRFVRMGAATAQRAAAAPPSVDPVATAKAAAVSAARRHAPGLVRGGVLDPDQAIALATSGVARPVYHRGTGRRGVWIRRGRRILLLGV